MKVFVLGGGRMVGVSALCSLLDNSTDVSTNLSHVSLPSFLYTKMTALRLFLPHR